MCFGVGLVVVVPSLLAWESITFDLPSGMKESVWRDRLAVRLHGQTEVKTEVGRADVVTSNEVFELDFQHKWKEGLGQVQAYAKELRKAPVLALISYGQGPERIQERSKQLFDIADSHCREHGVRLLVLFPSQPEERGRVDNNRERGTNTIDGVSLNTTQKPRWWISDSGVRHRAGCRWFHATNRGHFGEKSEGRPCKLCGG